MSDATGWMIAIVWGREKYFSSFMAEAASAALLAEWDVACT